MNNQINILNKGEGEIAKKEMYKCFFYFMGKCAVYRCKGQSNVILIFLQFNKRQRQDLKDTSDWLWVWPKLRPRRLKVVRGDRGTTSSSRQVLTGLQLNWCWIKIMKPFQDSEASSSRKKVRD